MSWRVRVRVSGVDRNQPFADECETLVVNLHGCAVQSPRPLRPGTAVQLEVANRILKGKVMDSVALGENQNRWMLGIALEQAGNHWGIQYPPEDWGTATPPPASQTAASDNTPRPASATGPLPGDATTENVTAKERRPEDAPLLTLVKSALGTSAARSKTPAKTQAAAEPQVSESAASPDRPEASPPPVPASEAQLEELRAQVLQLQQAQARQEAMLLQERAERQAARSAAEQAVADQLERVRQAKEYVESLVCSFPSLIEAQAQEQAQAILRRLPPASRSEMEKLVRDGQQATEAALEQRIAGLSEELRRQLEQTMEERRRASEAAHAAAARQLHELEERANHVTALVDVELQKHAEEIVAETLAEIRSQSQQISAGPLPSPSPVHVELEQGMQALVRQAADVAAELRQTLKEVQQEHRMNEAATARLHHRSEAVQTWMEQETEKFQQTVRDAFLDAGGQIRGRIAQAVETAVEPVEARGQDLQQEMAALAQQQIQQLHQQVEAACQRMESCSTESQVEIAAALQARVAEALDHFTRDAQRLAQTSIERWQVAITRTLAAIPKLLAENLSDEH